jgi:hypothetical protein
VSGNLARTLYRKIADISDRRRRSRLMIPISSERTATPTVYFLTPDHQVPAGGIRVIYRHVDILNSAGLKAFVLHQKPGFRCSWFEHDTQITNVENAKIRHGDMLVLPEVDADLLPRLSPGTRHVIFNQNAHLTWDRVTGPAMQAYAARPDLAGMLTVSSHNQEMLRHAFPDCAVQRVRISIDPQLFHLGQNVRPRRIAYMPRRGRDDARQVLAMLNGRGVLDDWSVVALDGLTHAEVADQLRTTRIFLAFTYQEGFGLPAAEAMACGNYVVGHHGFGGREFFRREFSAAIEAGDTLGFVRAVEEAVCNDREHIGWCSERGRKASDFILKEYSLAQEQEDVLTIYSKFMSSDYDLGRK